MANLGSDMGQDFSFDLKTNLMGKRFEKSMETLLEQNGHSDTTIAYLLVSKIFTVAMGEIESPFFTLPFLVSAGKILV